MFQRFHEIKSNQENEMMRSTGGESRSSTPGSIIDGRVMFSSHASPLPPQQASITSYPSSSSPSIMTVSPTLYYGTKYLPSTPPEAHRYSADNFRVSSEPTDQERYIIDSARKSVDPYRQLTGDGLNRVIHSDFQRIRVDNQITNTYHGPVEDIYNSPVNLQRVPETDPQQLITAQRIVSELQKMHADNLRSATSEQSSLRHELPSDSISQTQSANYRGSLQNSVRNSLDSNYRGTTESTLRTHIDPQRLVQESFKDFFPPPQSPKPSIDILRLTVDQRPSSENERYILADDVRSNPQNFSNNLPIPRSLGSDNLRVDVISSQEILSEDLRTGSHTPQNGLPEQLHIETEDMLPDNLRPSSSTPQSLGAENLRILHEESHNMITENLRLRGSHSMIIENHRIGTDSRNILMPENLRIASELSQNIDNLRGENDVISHGVMSDNLIVTTDGSNNLMPENLHVGSDLSHNLLTDNLRLNVLEAQHSMVPENLIRVGNDAVLSMIPENVRMLTNSSHSLIANHLRFEVENSRNSLAENLRLVADNHHGLIPENLRSEASRMVPENLCLAEPAHQALPEDLHISHTPINEGSISNSLDHQNGRILIHNQSSDSSLPIMRSHYDSSAHRIMVDNPHSVRVQSPRYSDVYRSDIQDNMNSNNPTTPAPPMQMGDLAGTPQYYSSSSYSSAHNNHYANYINDECDERESMSLEEKINRGYHDIKPFDQNYPIPMTLMHMPQETIQPPQTVSKPPKPKKPKEPKPPRLPVIHNCIECSRVFKNSTQLKNHMWRHTGEKPFTCDECGSKFTQQGNLRAHRRIHTGERPYECLECKTSFTQLSTLKTHQKIHSDERPYQCSECDAAFRQIANLKTHQVTHTGLRPHKCELCDKAFTQKSNLKAHKNRVHIGDGLSVPVKRGRKKNPVAIKPFNCPDCGAKFTMISNLKIHSKLHAGNRPYECDYCGAEFAQRSNMKTHIHRMHGKIAGVGRRRIRCDECPAMFRLKRCLKTHKKRRHPIKSLKIKILRESKYLMNSGPPASSEHDVDEFDDDEDDEFDDDDTDDDDDDGEEEESDEEILESQLLTKKIKSENKILGKNINNIEKSIVDKKEPIPVIKIEELKLEPIDEDQSTSFDVMEESRGGKRDGDLQAKSNNSEEDESSTSSKENDGHLKQRWEGRFNIKEELQPSPGNESMDLPLMSSNTS